LLEAGVKTNIHYVLNTDTVSEAISLLNTGGFPAGINAVVFLLHKPIGLGSREKMITVDNKEFFELLKQIDENTYPYKIGFDSCTVPGLINSCKNIAIDSFDTCEAARWSAYITADMKMLPCSFDNQAQNWSVDLKTTSIQEAWNSTTFDEFRNYFLKACPKCKDRNGCLGGCPISPEIILCEKKRKRGQ